MEKKTLSERMLEIRGKTDYVLPLKSYVLVAIDGRSFSKTIKKEFKQPFDDDFVDMMDETAKYVCENLPGCKFAYVQSDEITFVLTDFDNDNSSAFFGNRLSKLLSIIPSMASTKFNALKFSWGVKNQISGYNIEELDSMKLSVFDAKAWSVDNINDVYAYLLFRQNDCIRNSKQQVAQTYLSHKELLNLNADKQIELLNEKKGISWDSLSDGLKYGRFIYRSNINMYNGTVAFTRQKFFIHEGFILTREKFDDLNVIPVLQKEEEIYKKSRELGILLTDMNFTISTAESCTAGGIANRLALTSGSSNYFKGGNVTYTSQSKVDLLGVEESTLSSYGVVSSEVAIEMAIGSMKRMHTNIAISTTGIAGPDKVDGISPGTIYICIAIRSKNTLLLPDIIKVVNCDWESNNRIENINNTIDKSIEMLIDELEKLKS